MNKCCCIFCLPHHVRSRLIVERKKKCFQGTNRARQILKLKNHGKNHSGVPWICLHLSSATPTSELEELSFWKSKTF
ncbi:hypothetical protein HNY73_018807 [Argiope bruennichi]|uniref:Uncharacterized protein n=1 Tax=Argiope bruennichi TaxID=94029 RepID=A0A8T0EER3_ARGBR|nr:hypothetical protein HNY73_018807 [Argiope bruennichi]